MDLDLWYFKNDNLLVYILAYYILFIYSLQCIYVFRNESTSPKMVENVYLHPTATVHPTAVVSRLISIPCDWYIFKHIILLDVLQYLSIFNSFLILIDWTKRQHRCQCYNRRRSKTERVYCLGRICYWLPQYCHAYSVS